MAIESIREIALGEIKKEEEPLRIERDELRKTRYFLHLTLSKLIFPQRVTVIGNIKTPVETWR